MKTGILRMRYHITALSLSLAIKGGNWQNGERHGETRGVQDQEPKAAQPEQSRNLVAYLSLIASVAALAALSNLAGDHVLARLGSLQDAPTAPVLAALVLFGFCSFASFYATWKTPLPSFVAAIALGMAGHNLFAPIVAHSNLLASLVTACAALILFGGGLEMPLQSFLRLLVKILLLAVPGVLITGFALSWTAKALGTGLSFPLTSAVVILIGAILASTDPASIIPLLENLKFKRRTAKDIVIAESALNDVVAALLTTAFLSLPFGGLTLATAYGSLLSGATLLFLARQAGFGLLFGVAGCGLLWLLDRMKRGHPENFGPDQVCFLGIPILAFVGAALFDGSGFLAAFMAGLLFRAEDHMRGIIRFFFQMIDAVAKPVIFVLLGALVDIHALIAYAPIGIVVALVFMFVIRPVVVFGLLWPYLAGGKAGRSLTVNEVLFISFVRETGAIPAVLLVTALSRLTVPLNGLVEIGMWVILCTLVLAPPFTPFVARKLGIAQ